MKNHVGKLVFYCNGTGDMETGLVAGYIVEHKHYSEYYKNESPEYPGLVVKYFDGLEVWFPEESILKYDDFMVWR